MSRDKILNSVSRRISRESQTITYVDESDVIDAVERALDDYESEHGLLGDGDTDVIIDIYGRIYHDGNFVGWLRKDAGIQVIREFASHINAQMPVLIDDFMKIKEEK